jgi:hypothetical protein
MKCTREKGFVVIAIEPSDDRESIFHCVEEQNGPVVLALPDKVSPFMMQQDYTRLQETSTHASARSVIVVSGSEHLRKYASRAGLPAYATLDGLYQVLSVGSSCELHPDLSQSLPMEQEGGQYQPVQNARVLPQGAPLQGYTVPFAPPAARKKKRRGLILAVALIVLLLLSSGLFYLFTTRGSKPSSNTPAVVPPIAGDVYYLSSEQVAAGSNQGLDDEVLVDLHGLPTPAAGSSYYAWLLRNAQNGDASAIALGKLSVQNGSAHLLYPGDSQHQNLLEVTSRFLLTEESATIPPIAPSPATSTWRYYASFPQTVSRGTEPGGRSFSLLDHLRHLLVDDPTLKEMGLRGGLNAWLYQNSAKILEWALSERDYDGSDPQFLRRQIIRILAYLDGLLFVQQEIPPGTALPLNTSWVRMGLITMQPNQLAPSLLSHIVFHLNGLLGSVGATSEQRASAATIISALSNVNVWLSNMRTDARQLMAMTDEQLFSARAHTLYNDVVLLARAANDGQVSPDSGQVQEGVVWANLHLQSLATLTVSPFPA